MLNISRIACILFIVGLIQGCVSPAHYESGQNEYKAQLALINANRAGNINKSLSIAKSCQENKCWDWSGEGVFSSNTEYMQLCTLLGDMNRETGSDSAAVQQFEKCIDINRQFKSYLCQNSQKTGGARSGQCISGVHDVAGYFYYQELQRNIVSAVDSINYLVRYYRGVGVPDRFEVAKAYYVALLFPGSSWEFQPFKEQGRNFEEGLRNIEAIYGKREMELARFYKDKVHPALIVSANKIVRDGTIGYAEKNAKQYHLLRNAMDYMRKNGFSDDNFLIKTLDSYSLDKEAWAKLHSQS